MLSRVHNNLSNFLQSSLGLGSTIAGLLVFVLLIVLHLSITKYLWNNVLTSLTTVAKKCTSLWQMLGLTLLIVFVSPT